MLPWMRSGASDRINKRAIPVVVSRVVGSTAPGVELLRLMCPESSRIGGCVIYELRRTVTNTVWVILNTVCSIHLKVSKLQGPHLP